MSGDLNLTVELEVEGSTNTCILGMSDNVYSLVYVFYNATFRFFSAAGIFSGCG